MAKVLAKSHKLLGDQSKLLWGKIYYSLTFKPTVETPQQAQTWVLNYHIGLCLKVSSSLLACSQTQTEKTVKARHFYPNRFLKGSLKEMFADWKILKSHRKWVTFSYWRKHKCFWDKHSKKVVRLHWHRSFTQNNLKNTTSDVKLDLSV